MLGISWLAEELLASKEELCFMELVGFVLSVSATEGSKGFLHGVSNCARFGVLWWNHQRFSSYSDITLCHWTDSSHVAQYHSAVETLWTVRSVIQHNIPEVVNLQMKGVFYFGTSVLLGCCVSSCLCAGGDQRNIYKGELIFMLRCQSQSSEREEYRSLHWYICGWVRESSVLWEDTEWRAWSHGLLSSHVLQPSVLLAWHKW